MNLFFSLEGRIGRGYWWLGQLVLLITLTVGFLLIGAIAGASSVKDQEPEAAISAIALLLLVALIALSFWINLSVTVKRYHDRNKAGWWFLVGMIPLVGPFWQLIECGFLAGNPGSNDYGRPNQMGSDAPDNEEYLSAKLAAAFDDEINQRNANPRPANTASARASATGTGQSSTGPRFGARPAQGFGRRQAGFATRT